MIPSEYRRRQRHKQMQSRCRKIPPMRIFSSIYKDSLYVLKTQFCTQWFGAGCKKNIQTYSNFQYTQKKNLVKRLFAADIFKWLISNIQVMSSGLRISAWQESDSPECVRRTNRQLYTKYTKNESIEIIFRNIVHFCLNICYNNFISLSAGMDRFAKRKKQWIVSPPCQSATEWGVIL